MQRQLLRAVVLVGALAAVSLPTLGAPGAASACSNPGCVVTVGTPGQIETYVSPISVTAATATFAERATTAQVSSVSIPGTLSFTVLDARGNNEGFVASVSAMTFTSTLFPLLPIPPKSITVASAPTVTMTCYGPYACGTGIGLGSSVGQTMAASPPVAVECPLASIGEGQYAVSVPLNITATGIAAEKLGSYPASYYGGFTVSVAEGQPVASFAGFGCPSRTGP